MRFKLLLIILYITKFSEKNITNNTENNKKILFNTVNNQTKIV